jgi:hypothetical protein
MSLTKASAQSSSAPSWVLDLTTPRPPPSKALTITDPPGYTAIAPKRTSTDKSSKTVAPIPRRQPTPEEMNTLKLKKAWEIALAPAKQLPMQGIGMWMTGNSLQVFSIFMVFTLFKNPLVQILGTNSVFVPYETESTRAKLLMVKLAYIACNVLTLALGMYKVNAMGLLPYVECARVKGVGVANEEIGLHDRIGWRGRRSGYHWSVRIRRTSDEMV